MFQNVCHGLYSFSYDYGRANINFNIVAFVKLKGIVDAFSASLACEKGNWTSKVLEDRKLFQVNISTSSCQIIDEEILPGYWMPKVGQTNADILIGRLQASNCTHSRTKDDVERLLIMLGEYSISIPPSPHSPSITYSANSLLRFSSLVCKPEYVIKRPTVLFNPFESFSGSGVEVMLEDDTETTTIPQLSAWDIASGVLSSLAPSHAGSVDDNGTDLDQFFTLIQPKWPQANMSGLLDSEIVHRASRELYSSISTQMAHRYLLTSTNQSMKGISIVSERRLHIRTLSLRLTESILGLLIVISTIMCIWTPVRIVSRDPGSIGGYATILARSQALVDSLRGMGASSLNDLRHHLTGYQYQTVVNQKNGIVTFSIESDSRTVSGDPSRAMDTTHSSPIRWWRPFSVTIPSRVLILAVPIALIVSLEVLYQCSSRSDGIVDVDMEGYIRYSWVYIPTLTMVGVGMLFSMVDFSIKVFQPYHALRKGTASAEGSMLEDQLGRVGVHALWHAFIKRQYAIFTTTLAILLASFLTIAVSGLYIAEGVPDKTSISFRQRSDFNSTLALKEFEQRGEIYQREEACDVTSLIMNANLSYPLWTHNELAFPELDLLPMDASDNRKIDPNRVNATLVNLKTSAVRGAINCSVVPPNIYTTTRGNTTRDNNTRFDFQIPTGYCDGSYSDDFYVPEEGYFGKWLSGEGYFVESGDSKCPLLPIVYGQASSNHVKELIVLFCTPYAERIEVNTTFILPSYEIDPTHPPQPIEATTKYFMENPLGERPYLTSSLKILNDSFDEFFSMLTYGKDGIPAAELSGAENAPKLMNAMQHLFRIYVAQFFHNYRRIPVSPDAAVLNGTVMNLTRPRLKQSGISTRISQALLAAMFVCTAIAFWLMDTRRTLPNNPCSIAAVTSLLADSAFLKESIPEGSEWCTDTELKQRGVFEGYTFSLGWWSRDNGRKIFGIDVGTSKKAA